MNSHTADSPDQLNSDAGERVEDKVIAVALNMRVAVLLTTILLPR
jgi:hypothetical protein